MLVTRPEDVSYLTPFTGDDSAVVFGRDWAVLITDGRYAEQARRECHQIEVHVRTGAMSKAVAAAIRGKKVRRIGVQGEHVTLRAARSLESELAARRIRTLNDVIAPLRSVKDERELRCIRRAIRVAQRAFKELIADGARSLLGRSERDVAGELDYRMRCLGASSASFETVVAGGAHSSLPHYRPGATKIRPNQAVLLDWGAMVDGYCSDLTRVVFTCRIPPKLLEVYRVVLRAQAAGIAAIRPGATGRTVDGAARRVIVEAGYGKQFAHSLGHGLGRAVHEQPQLAASSSSRMRGGMVVTVEPGIYLPGIGGIRIEDDVLVTSTGHRKLSSLVRAPGALILR
jgi:Xaa-Pro aminopeptidase